MKATELRDMKPLELGKRLDELKGELFNLRFQHAINQLDNPQRIVTVRREIARVKTVINQRQLTSADITSAKDTKAEKTQPKAEKPKKAEKEEKPAKAAKAPKAATAPDGDKGESEIKPKRTKKAEKPAEDAPANESKAKKTTKANEPSGEET